MSATDAPAPESIGISAEEYHNLPPQIRADLDAWVSEYTRINGDRMMRMTIPAQQEECVIPSMFVVEAELDATSDTIAHIRFLPMHVRPPEHVLKYFRPTADLL